jgi:hypothetical protein
MNQGAIIIADSAAERISASLAAAFHTHVRLAQERFARNSLKAAASAGSLRDYCFMGSV